MSVGVVGQVVVQVIVLAVLARQLSPAEFGVAAAALVVLALSIIFADAGLGPALVQRKNLRTDHIRVAFTVTVILGLTVWLLLIAAAPAIAGLFEIPRLAPVLRVIGAVFFLRSLTVSDHLLQRQLDFRRLAAVELAALVLGYGIVAIVLAVAGAGVWAIVWGHVALAGLRTALLWFVSPHPFLPSLARQPLSELLRFGAALVVAKIAGVVATQGDTFIVGRWLGPHTLGLYGRAYQLMAMPALLFGHVATQVLFPAMAAVQDDHVRLRKAYYTAVAVIAVLTLPLSVAMAVTAREIVLVLLGSEWLRLLSAFNVLVFCMLFRASHKISDCLALATGAIYRRATRQWVYAGMVVLGTLLGQRWGLLGVAVGLGVALLLNFLFMAQLSLVLIEMSWRQFVGAHVAAVFLSMLVAAVAWPIATMLRGTDAPAAVVLIGTWCAAGLFALIAVRSAPQVPGMRATVALLGDVRMMIGSGSARALLDRLAGRRDGTQEGEAGL